MQESQAITRKSASNLVLGFRFLPEAKRDGMSALYAFCREVDDVADEQNVPIEKRREQLAAWRQDVSRACSSEIPHFAVNRELQVAVRRYHLPFEYFDALLQGVEMDLEITRYSDYDQLELYCYRVASVVGLLSIEIFGYSDPACRNYAIYLGKALQLTNILRDVQIDAERGRIYLPETEMNRFGIKPDELLRGEYSTRFADLARSVAERASHFYRLASKTLPVADRRSMAAAELMGAVYWRLLRKLEHRRFNVFGASPVRLTKLQKLMLVMRTSCRIALGAMTPNYGV